MILSTHAVAGASISVIFRGNPAAGIALAFLSHFLLDAFPHWHYRILSRIKDQSLPFGEKLAFNEEFLKDILRTGVDFGIGLGISLAVSQFFFPGNSLLVFLGALAGALPDALQVVYHRFPNSKPLYYLQLFHEKAHSKVFLDEKPVRGILQEVAVSIAFIYAAVLLI